MTRMYIDCREHPGDKPCSVALAADNAEELITAAAQHAVSVHGMKDGPELRNMLKQAIHQGTPPLTVRH